jgi:hypothetical protein
MGPLRERDLLKLWLQSSGYFKSTRRLMIGWDKVVDSISSVVMAGMLCSDSVPTGGRSFSHSCGSVDTIRMGPLRERDLLKLWLQSSGSYDWLGQGSRFDFFSGYGGYVVQRFGPHRCGHNGVEPRESKGKISLSPSFNCGIQSLYR